jgi:hypothetical protein
MAGRVIADATVVHFTQLFDLSLSKEKMMDMMPGLLLFLARRPEMVEPVMKIMLPMMDQMDIHVDHDLLIEMMPAVVKAVDQEPGLGGAVFLRMVPMLESFDLKMDFYVMKRVMGMMMKMVWRHPGVIPTMMRVMPRMMDMGVIRRPTEKRKGVTDAGNAE